MMPKTVKRERGPQASWRQKKKTKVEAVVPSGVLDWMFQLTAVMVSTLIVKTSWVKYRESERAYSFHSWAKSVDMPVSSWRYTR